MCKNVDCMHSTLPVGAKAPTLCFDQLQGHHCGLELVEAALVLAATLQVCPA